MKAVLLITYFFANTSAVVTQVEMPTAAVCESNKIMLQNNGATLGDLLKQSGGQQTIAVYACLNREARP